MKKIGKMAEMAWVIGTVLCAFGVVLCTKSGLGLSMMAAPPYILHITLRDLLPWFTQGTAQYLFEGSMLLVMCVLIGRFRLRFLLSFLSGVIYGVVLDLWLLVMGGNGQYVSMVARVMSFAAGIGCISLAVAFMFRTYLPPQIPELFVMRVADRFRAEQPRIKLVLDLSCLALSFILALALTGKLTGIGVGTVVIAVANAPLIRLWSKPVDKFFSFEPMFPALERWLK